MLHHHLSRITSVSKFEADVLGENNWMLKIFANSGFALEARERPWGIVQVIIPAADAESFSR
jgi:hypothetical protein